MLKNGLKTFFYAAVYAIGAAFGWKLFNDMSDPVKRANVKKKFKRIKEAITDKE